MNKVLILGAGLVARPIVVHLLNNGYTVTLADIDIKKAEELISGHVNGIAVSFSVEDETALHNLVVGSDLVVSLLPWMFHIKVARKCIELKRNMLTTSYVKPEMMELDQKAKDAGIIILNETGLDPGIDHMSAKRIIDDIHNAGGKVEAFYSVCGALPAPEAADNPFSYKFSWSPKGVIMAGNNDAKYLFNNEVVELSTEKLFSKPLDAFFPGVGKLQIYPNRDSVPYIDLYSIKEAKTMYRGTFRYPGWCEIINGFKKLNLISYDKHDFSGMSYADCLAFLTKAKNKSNLKGHIKEFLEEAYTSRIIESLEWLGFFSDEDMGRADDSAFEITSDLMISKMLLNKDERDMVAMMHMFVAVWKDGRKEVIRSVLLDFGIPGSDTAVARTVALPAAVAAEMILKNEINLKGVHIPVVPEIYNPILNSLETMGIRFNDEYDIPFSEVLF